MKDDGFATVTVLALCGVLAATGGLVAVLGEVAVARHHAAAAADLAALAGAAHVLDGSACTAAAGVARRNGATMSTCQVQGEEVTVAVTVPPPAPWARWGPVQARARAGPGTSPPS